MLGQPRRPLPCAGELVAAPFDTVKPRIVQDLGFGQVPEAQVSEAPFWAPRRSAEGEGFDRRNLDDP